MIFFQVQENYPTSFNQEAIQAPPTPQTYLSIYLLLPLVLTYQFILPSHNWQGIPSTTQSPQFVEASGLTHWSLSDLSDIKILLSHFWPRQNLDLWTYNNNQRPVIIKILSSHFLAKWWKCLILLIMFFLGLDPWVAIMSYIRLNLIELSVNTSTFEMFWLNALVCSC